MNQRNFALTIFDVTYFSSVFLLSITGQIASASFEGNGASAGDTELYCKVSNYFFFISTSEKNSI